MFPQLFYSEELLLIVTGAILNKILLIWIKTAEINIVEDIWFPSTYIIDKLEVL